MGIGEDFPSPPIPLAGQAFVLVDSDGVFQGFRISQTDADGRNNSLHLSRINGQPITIVYVDGTVFIYVANSVTFVPGANPYYNMPPGEYRGSFSSGVAYIDYNTSLPALVSGTTIKTINGNSILGNGNIVTSNSTIYYMNLSVSGDPYYELSSSPSLGNETSMYFFVNPQESQVISYFVTPFGTPGLLKVPSGTWQFSLCFRNNNGSTLNTQTWVSTVQVFKRTAAGVETLIASTVKNINDMYGTTQRYLYDVVVPETTLISSDRIVVKILMQNTQLYNWQSANFITEGSVNYSLVTTNLNQTVPKLKTINGNRLAGNGSINILPGRTRSILVGNSNQQYIGNIGGMQSPFELEFLVETWGSANTFYLYLSYSSGSVSAGSILIGKFTGASTIRTYKFKRTIRTFSDSGSGEEGYYWSRSRMWALDGNVSARTDEESTGAVAETQYYFDSSSGSTSYPTEIIATTNYTGYMTVLKIEQGT
jgi:hypothetical protein